MNTSGLAYFYVNRSTFVSKEASIFENNFVVFEFDFYSKKKKGVFLLFLKQFIFLFKHVFNTDLYVCQFAGYHSFLPGLFARLFGKKLLIVSGGTDCVSYPTIRYGNFYKKTLRLFTSWSYRLAHHISPKHESLWLYSYNYDPAVVSIQGIKAFLPNLKTPHTSIPNGYDTAFWKCGNGRRHQNRFITVSSGFQYSFQQKLKGIDLILSAAPSFPDCEFQIIGVSDSSAFGNIPSNVSLLPPMNAQQLREAYCSAGYYLQVSMAEGFPNALCEAMLCGCVPIGSAVFSIPEIIGSHGFILEKRDESLFKELLKNAISHYSPEIGKAASASIADRYSISRRKTELTALCLSLTGRD